MRRFRARRKASLQVQTPLFDSPTDPIAAADAVAQWSESCLVVPPGHSLAGQPMKLPDYGCVFLRDALASREAILCCARKNSKSAVIAVLLLA